MYHKLQLKTEKSNNQCLRIFLFVWKKLYTFLQFRPKFIDQSLFIVSGGGGEGEERGGITWFLEWRWGEQSSSTESTKGRLQKINCQQEIIISSCQLTDHEEGLGIHKNIKSLIGDQVNFIMTHQNPLLSPPPPSLPPQAVDNDRFIRIISEWHFNMSFRTPQKWLTCNLS